MSRASRYIYIQWGTCITISFGLKIMKTPKEQTFRFRKSKKKKNIYSTQFYVIDSLSLKRK